MKQPVIVLETVEIQSRSVQFIKACLHTALNPSIPMEGLIEPTQTPYTPKHIMIASSLSKVDNGNRVIVQVINISPGNITLCKGAPLSEFIPIHDVFFVDSNHDTQTEHILSPIVDVDLSSSNLSTRDKQRLYKFYVHFEMFLLQLVKP